MASERTARLDVAHQILGLLACGEVYGFHTMADAAARAEDIADSVSLMTMAIDHADGYRRTRQRLLDHGVEADALIGSFDPPLANYYSRTRPADEYQSLLKAYVGTGIAADFVREMAAHLDSETRDFIMDVLSRPRAEEFVVPRLRTIMAREHQAAGPMALWGRRLMGEALSQAQRVAVDRPDLVTLIVGPDDLEGFQQMIARMTAAHSDRMRALGLYA
jgi:hypothetical protein